MQKKLAEIDTYYSNSVSNLSLQERLRYCDEIIDKVVSEIIKRKNFFDDELIEQWIEILTAVKKEKEKLMKKNKETCQSFKLHIAS